MKREVKITGDGTGTLYVENLDESYHSTHGALQEAKHVFIKNGLQLINNYEINILEMGFGTGLNVLVTLDELIKSGVEQSIHYFALEKYPVTPEEVNLLDYPKIFDSEEIRNLNQKIHAVPWNEEVEILPNFFLTKIECDFFDLLNIEIPPVDLVYYDCFGARVQPNLWEKPLFEAVAGKMKEGGLLTTYSSKGSVRRVLQELGFLVEKKPGPPGKREMINATKQ